MSVVNARLARCFSAVFPSLEAGAVATASVDTVSEWDSLASLTLVAVIEEEFSITIDDLDLPGLTSFEAASRYVQAQVA
jgi:acyl carrier protein